MVSPRLACVYDRLRRRLYPRRPRSTKVRDRAIFDRRKSPDIGPGVASVDSTRVRHGADVLDNVKIINCRWRVAEF